MSTNYPSLLEVRNLTLKLKIKDRVYPVVNDVSFELQKGQTVALVGESGCGKTLTALSILRILPEQVMPPEGEIRYRGHDLLTLKEAQMRLIRGRRIAMIFQDPMSSLNPVYPIGVQLLESLEAHWGLGQEAGLPIVLQALEDVRLPTPKEVIRLYPHQLSGGMLQRVMIAMALLCEPDILIADEPTTALDVTIQAQILVLLKELQEKKGMATLLITHDMGVVAQNADTVVVMYGGHHVEQGSVYALFDNPAHPYTQALFAARPDPMHPKKQLSAIPGSVPRVTERPEGCPFHPRCAYAMDLCKGAQAPFFPLKQKEHTAKCWLYDAELETKLETS